MNKLLPLALPLTVALILYATGLTHTLGAHPWWAVKIIWIGLCLGLLVSAILWATRLLKPVRVIVLSGLTLVAFAIANIGKTRFVASYAEDAIAGQMWYFGWMATCTFFLAVLATAVWPTRNHQ